MERPKVWMTAIVGTVVALVLVAIAQAADANLLVTSPGADTPSEVPIGMVLLMTALGGVVGFALASLARRFASRPPRTFLIICLVLLVVDGITPFSSSDQASTGFWLNSMHLAAALPIVGSLFRALPLAYVVAARS